MMTTTHAEAYARTDAGKVEIRAHAVKLSRSARNLLLVIDATRTGDDWIEAVNGSGPGDLDLLLAARLIAPQADATARLVYQRIPVETAVRDWTYDALYALLTQEAKEQFGFIKGYRLILKIEGCSDLDSIQATALDFVEQLRKAQGEEAAARFRKQLGATE